MSDDMSIQVPVSVAAENVNDGIGDSAGSSLTPAAIEAPTQESAETIRDSIERILRAIQGISEQVQCIPPQIRSVSGRIDGIATQITESRYRSLLHGLAWLLDLIDQMRTEHSQNGEVVDHRANLEVLRTQLRQLLESNGLREISASGSFDPRLHKAVDSQPSDDPADADRILRVVRPGYRTEGAVLRYAEVVVGRRANPVTVNEAKACATGSI